MSDADYCTGGGSTGTILYNFEQLRDVAAERIRPDIQRCQPAELARSQTPRRQNRSGRLRADPAPHIRSYAQMPTSHDLGFRKRQLTTLRWTAACRKLNKVISITNGCNLPAETKHPSAAELRDLLRHYQNGRYGDAEKLGRSITQRFPRHQLSWKLLGAALNQAQKLQESLIPNQRAVDLDPKDAEAHILLGSTLQQLDRLEQAEASYRKAIALRPDFASAHYYLGARGVKTSDGQRYCVGL